MVIDFVDPRSVDGWDAALAAAGDRSFFHTAAWAAVLSESYRYEPLYQARESGPGFDLVMPLMEVRSSLTGLRGVSLPFTDHCLPFAAESGLVEEARAKAMDYGRKAGWKFIEWRDGGPSAAERPAHETYFTHRISLERQEDELFSGLKETNRRNVRKARREGVTVTFDPSGESLEAFCRLNDLTRRRHGLPPQPSRFFKNVHKHILAKGLGIVALARQNGGIIAASVYFLFAREALFKYGASDHSRQGIRPGNLLMWEAIRWLKANGFSHLDLGRTEPENEGLLRYKRAWGGEEGTFDYHRYSFRTGSYIEAPRRIRPAFFKRVVGGAPLPLLRVLGGLLYRHVG
jgi:hypothetical protein